MRTLIILAAVCFAGCTRLLSAGVIVDVSGEFDFDHTSASPDPFGGFDYVASSWTQTGTFTDVDVSFVGNAVFASAVGMERDRESGRDNRTRGYSEFRVRLLQ
jgi:hypothetical protein